MKPCWGRACRRPGLGLGLLLLVVGVLCLAGCGGSTGGVSVHVQSVFISYYYVLPGHEPGEPFTARLGDRVQLLPFGRSDATTVPLPSGVTWSSSLPAVASVDADGYVTAQALGVTEVTCTYAGLTSDPLTVTVEAVGPQPGAQFYPLGLAYHWSYTGTAVEPTAVGPAAEEVTLTVTCSAQVVIDGEVWWELEIRGTDPAQPAGAQWLRQEGQGLLDWAQGSQWWVLQEPLEGGNTWVDPADLEHHWEIVSTTVSVTVPAGTYAGCLQVVEHWITGTGIPYTTTAWLAPGVGTVRTLTAYTDPNTHLPVENEQKLVTYQLGPV